MVRSRRRDRARNHRDIGIVVILLVGLFVYRQTLDMLAVIRVTLQGDVPAAIDDRRSAVAA